MNRRFAMANSNHTRLVHVSLVWTKDDEERITRLILPEDQGEPPFSAFVREFENQLNHFPTVFAGSFHILEQSGMTGYTPSLQVSFAKRAASSILRVLSFASEHDGEVTGASRFDLVDQSPSAESVGGLLLSFDSPGDGRFFDEILRRGDDGSWPRYWSNALSEFIASHPELLPQNCNVHLHDVLIHPMDSRERSFLRALQGALHLYRQRPQPT